MVELNIDHSFIAGEGTLVDDGDWNAHHLISGGGTLRVPQLIEEKVVGAGATSVTFSGLDGDTDEEYVLEGDVILVPTGSDSSLVLYPNNDTGANYVGVALTGTSGGTTGSWSTGKLRMGESNSTKTTYVKFKNILFAKTGVIRQFGGDAYIGLSGVSLRLDSTGHWTNTSSNITSLVCSVTNGSFSGTIRLYKMVDLVLD